MSDVHADLTAEWRALMNTPEDVVAGDLLARALRHILRRLGPPTLTDASDIEFREASDG